MIYKKLNIEITNEDYFDFEELDDSIKLYNDGELKFIIYASSIVYCHSNFEVSTYACSRVVAFDNTEVIARGMSRVDASDKSRVTTLDLSKVYKM